MQLRRLILLSAGLAVIAARNACACPDNPVKTAAIAEQRPASAFVLLAWKPRAWSPVAASGLRVSIDPVDGAYSMPVADETPQATILREDAPVAVTRRANGSMRAQLDERFADFAVATLPTVGKPRWTCVHGSTQANQFMLTPSPALAPAPGTVWVEK